MNVLGSASIWAGGSTGDEPEPMVAAILAPLRDLLRRYDAAVAVMVGVRSGIEEILSTREPSSRPDPLPSSPSPLATSPTVRIEAGEASADAILAFTEGLSSLPGVKHVTVAGATSGRTNFFVELMPPDPAPASGEAEEPPTLV